ncbi:hypothetical protein Peur_063423 [Populus x canadensis]
MLHPRVFLVKNCMMLYQSTVTLCLVSNHVASLGREPSPMELFVETHVRSQDCQKGVQQFVDNRAQHFVETYNSRLRERYGDNPLTHPDFDPDLWMELRQIVMEMRSKMGDDTCAASFWPYGPGNNQPPPPPPAPPLF